MARTGTSNLGGLMTGISPADVDFWNNQMTPEKLLGLNRGNQSRAAGAALPLTTAAGGDRSQVWWHPDSPFFWLGGAVLLAVLGIAGVHVRVRESGHAGPVREGASANAGI